MKKFANIITLEEFTYTDNNREQFQKVVEDELNRSNKDFLDLIMDSYDKEHNGH